MAEALTHWVPRSAWDGVLKPGHHGAKGPSPLRIEAFDGTGLALLAAPEAARESLAGLFRHRLGINLPKERFVSQGRDHVLLWSGPGKWLLRSAISPETGQLLKELSAFAAITDQSDGRAVLRLSGEHARAVLAKGVMVDLHPQVFAPGATLITPIAHIRVQIWRVDDGSGPPTFEILIPRSMAGSFWSWLFASAAEFGMEVATVSN